MMIERMDWDVKELVWRALILSLCGIWYMHESEREHERAVVPSKEAFISRHFSEFVMRPIYAVGSKTQV